MGKIAFVFSGQGAQYGGMGKSFYDASKTVSQFFDNCEKIRPGTLNQTFSGSDEELKKTSNTQPCMYLTELAGAISLNEKGVFADGCAGFSLGEISALAMGGAYSYEDGFRIVSKRAELMEEVSQKFDTAMAAVLKLDPEAVKNEVLKYEQLYAVNFNSPAQVVVSGLSESVKAFSEDVKNLGGRAVPLAVSAAFHSPFMAEAADGFKSALGAFDIKSPKLPVYSNVNAKPYEDNTDIAENLSMQIKSPVLWQQTIENMIADGFTDFIEVGPGKTLCGLIKKISKDVNVYSAETDELTSQIASEVKCNA